MSNPHLTDAERRILACVSKPDSPVTRDGIAEAAGTHAVTVSKAICKLERLGLLVVERAKSNKQGGLRSYSKITVTGDAEAA